MQRDNRIDVVLSGEDKIQPSSGFADSVMRAIRTEAAAPPPIAFPWKHAVPGLVAIVLLIAGLLSGFSSGAIAHSLSVGSYTIRPALTNMLAHLLTTGRLELILVSFLSFVLARFFIRLQLFR